MTNPLLSTNRLTLRRLAETDADFIFGLVNQPSWIEFIGDRGVRTLDDARAYIRNGPMASYEQHGFGLYLTTLTADGTPIGICGLLKRDTLEHPDIGFAFLPEHWSRGYAFESASAVLDYARTALALPRVLAITSPANARSIRVLEKLGLAELRRSRMKEDADEVLVFG